MPRKNPDLVLINGNKVVVPAAFEIDPAYDNITPKANGSLDAYAWAIEVTTGARISPASAVLLMTHLHPEFADPASNIATSERENIMSDIVLLAAEQDAVSRSGKLYNIKGPNLKEWFKTNDAKLNSPEVIGRMQRINLVHELKWAQETIAENRAEPGEFISRYPEVKSEQAYKRKLSSEIKKHFTLTPAQIALLHTGLEEKAPYPMTNRTTDAFVKGDQKELTALLREFNAPER